MYLFKDSKPYLKIIDSCLKLQLEQTVKHDVKIKCFSGNFWNSLRLVKNSDHFYTMYADFQSVGSV